MTEEHPRKKNEGGGAGWITTFADLMSLLMCFFVLLLSFAELDVMKFKAIAGSMRLAFGVQRDIKAIEVPKGTSIIAQEFSSGKPDPSVISEVRQQTTEEDKQTLEFTDALVNETDGEDQKDSDGGEEVEANRKTEADAKELVEALKDEVDEGMIQIETQGASIVIRIREKGSFPSGTARFDGAFEPVLGKIRASLLGIEGRIAVAGHTDDIPIKTALYRSNWDLSSARAVSVVHALLDGGELKPVRFVVEGHGDAHPLVPNDTPANRAHNRRVEITIHQDEGGTDAVHENVAAYAGEQSGADPGATEAVSGSGTAPEPAPEPDEQAVDGSQDADAAQAPPADAPAKPKSRLELIRDGMNGA